MTCLERSALKPDLARMLESAPVVPLLQTDDPDTGVRIAKALSAGGMPAIEVVLRTDRALECLQAVAERVPKLAVGAGTVLNVAQAEQSLAAGARFVVSPGLDEDVIRAVKDRGIPIYPGIYTPTELQRAVNLGLDVVKFFPASIAGGVPALKALSSVFRGVRFMPTGGISADNLADFLAIPTVLACGGSWLTPADAVARGDYGAMTALAKQALAIASAAGRA